MILVVVGDENPKIGSRRKVGVEIDTTRLDPFYYNPIWEKYEIEVEEVDYEDQIGDEVQIDKSKD